MDELNSQGLAKAVEVVARELGVPVETVRDKHSNRCAAPVMLDAIDLAAIRKACRDSLAKLAPRRGGARTSAVAGAHGC